MRLAMLALFLAACDPMAGKAKQPDLVSRSDGESVLLVPAFQPSRDAVAQVCGAGKTACTRLSRRADGTRMAIIVAVEPRDFNDFNATETLGHEAWHALGATHQ